MQACQAAGIPAGAVLKTNDLVRDRHSGARLFEEVTILSKGGKSSRHEFSG